MPDILTDAQETLEAFDRGDFVANTEFARQLRALVTEVRMMRKIVEDIVRLRSHQHQQAELLKLAPKAPWVSEP